MNREQPKQASRRKLAGFGFDPAESTYHFVLKRRADGSAAIIERLSPPDDEPAAEPERAVVPAETEKARLSAYLWERVAEQVAAEFNDRLLAGGARSAKWLSSETPLAPHFGKELTLLAWAVEDADPTVVPAMLANWRGLAPEERWWFYTTINATSGHAEYGKDRGWRKAIKIAFADNPVHVAPSSLLSAAPRPEPKKKRPARSAETDVVQGSLALFNEEPTA